MAAPFILKYLSISKMPGFDRGMRAYRDFAANINIIAGPNASGKSSTARIIQQVIWRDNTAGIIAESAAEIDGKRWDFRINSHSVQVQQEGIDAQLKGLPARESGGRYELALHKLVLERDEEIAREIARLASGGYNLEKAEEQLGYSARVPDRRLAQFSAYESARRQHREIEQQQKRLKEDEQRLQQLKLQRERSAKAEKLLHLFEKVIAYKTAVLKMSQSETALQQFPEVLAQATGQEASNVKDWEAAVAKKEQGVAIEKSGWEKSAEKLKALRIPAEGLTNELLLEMEERVGRLGELEREIATTEAELAKSMANEQTAAAGIGADADPEQWNGIDLEGIGKLDQFLLKAHKIIGEKQYCESWIRELEGELTDGLPEPEKLRAGIGMLNAWLNWRPYGSRGIDGGREAGMGTGRGSGESSSEISGNSSSSGTEIGSDKETGRGIGMDSDRRSGKNFSEDSDMGFGKGTGKGTARGAGGNAVSWYIPIIAAAGALTAAATLWVDWPGLVIGLTVIAGLTIAAYLKKSGVVDESIAERELRRRDYEKTGLPEPERWEDTSVEATIGQLQDNLQKALWQSEIEMKIGQFKKTLEGLQPGLQQLERERNELLEKLKAVPEVREADLKDNTQLYWFVVHVQEWQQHRKNSDALRATAEKLREAFSNELTALNALFGKAEAGEAADKTTAKTIYDRLREEEEIRRNAVREIAGHKEKLEELEKELEELESAIAKTYSSLEMELGDKRALDQLMEQVGPYNAAKEELRSARQRLHDRKGEMTEHSMYGGHAAEIETMTIDKAEGEKMKYEAEAGTWKPTTEQIAKIEAGIGTVRSGSSLEKALAEEENALAELAEAFEKNLAAQTGKLLTDGLRADSYGNNPSEVYNRANELFGKITAGRYGLRIDDRQNGGFRAYDNAQNIGKELEELSTGTRIQLLLSVRLAYIEQQEENVKLPVLADELLANCDDIRAAAIIEALIEISKEGRQVFYFTAQTDEVAKWRYFLEREKQVEHKIFELTGDAEEPMGYNDPISYSESGNDEAMKFFQEVAEPGNMTHEAYGKAVGVVPFDPVTEETEQIHLWYILEDTEVLYECLRRNIRSWGQLRSFMELGGSVPGLSEAHFNQLEAQVRLLQSFITLHRQGRSRPIDIVVLENSGAVSPAFTDAVNSLLKRLRNDPAALIEALRNKEVAGFRENKINDLEEYLTAEGYISRQEKLDPDGIVRRLHATFPEMEKDSSAVERMTNRVT
ncbi:MAG: hypothetical protein WD577_05425 [Bacteroidales bacterium]